MVRQIGTHKTQRVHRMLLLPSLPLHEIEDNEKNQMYVYPDANAKDDAIILDKNLPITQEDSNAEQPEDETTEINHQTESPTFSDVHTPEFVARMISSKCDTPRGRHRQAITRTQLRPMEIDEDHDDRVPCTLVAEGDQSYKRDNPAVSHKKPRRRRNIHASTNNTTRVSRSTETRYNLRANPTLKRYAEFLIQQISDARAALRPVGTRRDGTRTH